MKKQKRNNRQNKSMAPAQPTTTIPPVVVRNSRIHGKGVYALRGIKKGERIVEYLGERISHAEADRRYTVKGEDDGHTFLFIASNRTVIDGASGGNDARYINHRCDPNCESVIDNRRVFIEAIRDIEKDEELGYDYQLTWESDDDPEDLANYGCRCGSARCRGTMLDREPLDILKKKQALAIKRREARKKKTAKKRIGRK